MLNMKTRYAMRALQYLAQRTGDGAIQIQEIATESQIPRKFLTVILSELSREGLVDTRRGRNGGYWLARPAAEISYGDIVRITRGSLALVPCAARNGYSPCENCVPENECHLHFVMLAVRDATAAVLDSLSLADPPPTDAKQPNLGTAKTFSLPSSPAAEAEIRPSV